MGNTNTIDTVFTTRRQTMEAATARHDKRKGTATGDIHLCIPVNLVVNSNVDVCT